MILILSDQGDEHADLVEKALFDRNVRYRRFGHTEFPTASTLAIEYDGTGARPSLRWRNDAISHAEIGAIWYRRPAEPVYEDPGASPAVKRFVVDECKAALLDFWETFSSSWLPGTYARIRHAGLKAMQLGIAAQLGFDLPPTLITNDPDRLLDFYEREHGEIISKCLGPTTQKHFSRIAGRFTELVSRQDLTHVSSLHLAPMIFQGYVPKRVELRVTVVGEKVFAAEIHSQSTNHTRVDWRRYDFGHTPYASHQLPEEISRRCVALTERLGLSYSTIDMILTPEGRYVFLELNPNGQYLWIEFETGLPITAAICDLLERMDGTSHDRH